MFVLLGRDPIAPILVGLWVELRKSIGDGNLDKLREAEECGQAMAEYLVKPELPKKGDFTRGELLGKAILTLRQDFVRLVSLAVDFRSGPTTRSPAKQYYQDIDRVIAYNTGLVGRAERKVEEFVVAGHSYQSARMALIKYMLAAAVSSDVLGVYLIALDRAFNIEG
jgi:hypothetical protein